MKEESFVRELSTQDTLKLSVEIVSSYVANNFISAEDLPDLLHAVHHSLSRLGEDNTQSVAASAERQKPAVPISRSVHDTHIFCLEDGKKLTMLKRYLRSRYDMSPDDYRRKWRLPSDYPMVAPDYASRRSEFAKSIGLGKGERRKAGQR